MSSFDPPGYSPQPGYQQGWGPQVPAPGTNVMAIVSLVLSLVWICGIGSIAAIVTGFVALKQIKRTGEQNRIIAIVGILLGILGLLVALVLVLAVLIPVFLNETR